MSHRKVWEKATARETRDVNPDTLEDAEGEWFAGLKPKAASRGAGAAHQEPRGRIRNAVAAIAEDPKYAGAVVSRKDALRQQGADDSEEEHDGQSAEDDSEEEGGDDFDEGDDDDDDEDDDEGEEDEDDDDDEGGEADEDDDEDAEGEGSDDSDAASEYDATEAANPVPRQRSSALRRAAAVPQAAAAAFGADIDAELAALRAADAGATAALAKASRSDAAQGAAARTQLALYDALLEARIRLQHSVAAAPRLPPAAVVDALAAAQPRLTAAAAGLRAEVSALICDLLRLRQAVALANPEVAESLPTGDGEGGDGLALPPGVPPLAGSKRRRLGADSDDEEAGEEDEEGEGTGAGEPVPVSLGARLATDALWASLHGGWQALAAWRDETLDKWGRRLLLAQGVSQRQAGRLKALNAGLSQQVQDVLRDSDRLIARSRPPASSVHVLGVPPAAPGAGEDDEDGRCADAYDDGEFYQHLLRELLASGGGGGGGAGGEAGGGLAAGLKPYERRVRPNVDRRASKARRLKFVPLPKLVAFAAPAPFVVPPELAVDIDTVVASLFRAGGGGGAAGAAEPASEL